MKRLAPPLTLGPKAKHEQWRVRFALALLTAHQRDPRDTEEWRQTEIGLKLKLAAAERALERVQLAV